MGLHSGCFQKEEAEDEHDVRGVLKLNENWLRMGGHRYLSDNFYVWYLPNREARDVHFESFFGTVGEDGAWCIDTLFEGSLRSDDPAHEEDREPKFASGIDTSHVDAG